MENKNIYRIVLVTAPHEREAEKLARILVEKRLAACANLVPKILALPVLAGSEKYLHWLATETGPGRKAPGQPSS